IKSILGLIKPEKAKVIVDKNIIKFREMNEFFRQNVGYASQNNLVLNSSLLQNITLEENIDQLTERQLIKLKKVFLESGLEQFFNFKNDLKKLITEDGKNISGGQLQRISLARALYFSNGILVLDEICSSLDISSEKKIIDILKKLSYNHIIIYITHRENFFKEFNQVIKID
ncbi:ATP-binding cassette domain-containing protein, partial [Candidatus Pelagibacter sp.]|nr:ATP-binding cassette domain-containing protein [Candidatus Pelagibacter sp.]